MNFTSFRGIQKLSDLSADLYNKHWISWISFWNDTDNGKIPLSNISFGVSTNSQSSNYTVTISDNLILMDTTSGVLTITLPTAVGIKGKQYIIFNIGSKFLIVSTSNSQTINGNTSTTIPNKYFHIQVFSDGSNWVAI